VKRRERQVWIAAVAVFATSLAWLAAIDLAWLAHAWVARMPAVRAVARALFRVVWWGLGHGPLAVVTLAAVAVLVVLAVAIREGGRLDGGVRHA
jgi:hypothetical protein